MKKYILSLSLLGLIYFLPLEPLLAGSLSGQIESPARVKKLIIYLSKENSPLINNSPIKHPISQKNTQFSHYLSIISVGDSIEWSNDETKEIDHNIFSLSKLRRFDLGLGAKGSILSQTFDKTGVLNYYCSVHKTMEGKVVILPSPYYQLLDLKQTTTFKIENLPKGTWLLNAVVFHRRYKVDSIKVTINKDELILLNLKVIKR